jgi:hypothetical protein
VLGDLIEDGVLTTGGGSFSCNTQDIKEVSCLGWVFVVTLEATAVSLVASKVHALALSRRFLRADAVRPPEQGDGMCARADFKSFEGGRFSFDDELMELEFTD